MCRPRVCILNPRYNPRLHSVSFVGRGGSRLRKHTVVQHFLRSAVSSRLPCFRQQVHSGLQCCLPALSTAGGRLVSPPTCPSALATAPRQQLCCITCYVAGDGGRAKIGGCGASVVASAASKRGCTHTPSCRHHLDRSCEESALVLAHVAPLDAACCDSCVLRIIWCRSCWGWCVPVQSMNYHEAHLHSGEQHRPACLGAPFPCFYAKCRPT